MPKNHRSFFERLTGSISADDKEKEEELLEDEKEEIMSMGSKSRERIEKTTKPTKNGWINEEEEGQLAVDVFQTPAEIIIQAVVAGVKPDELDASITQDMVTIRGRRQKQREISGEDYYYQELYWGSFSRSILLPQEIDAEASEATLKNGILTIRLPKLDKNRVQKLRVKNE